MSSYDLINYNLRPAKSIERKMLVETFQRLSTFDSLVQYRYIGFGSTNFSDFILFHKTLGIFDMVSVEKEVGDEERFEFNRPYNCIDIKFGESNAELPKLDWGKRSIIWLDYDGILSRSVLTDINFVCAKVSSGSMLIITVNAHPHTPTDVDTSEWAPERLEFLSDQVGEENIPPGLEGKDLVNWGTANVYSRIIRNNIEKTLLERNGGIQEGNRMKYHQILNFNYADGAKMSTLGIVFCRENESPLYEACKFNKLSFYRNLDEPYLLEVPVLTFKEIRHLNSQLPTNDINEIDAKGIKKGALEKYSKIYRYFPTFSETEL